MKSAINKACSRCTEPNTACIQKACPLWPYNKTGNQTAEWNEHASGCIPSRSTAIAGFCFLCKGWSEEAIEQCDNRSCPLWKVRRYKQDGAKRMQELIDTRSQMGLDPMDRQSPYMRLIGSINGIAMQKTDDALKSNDALKSSTQPKRRSRIKEDVRKAIRSSHASVRTLAKRHGCSPTTIQKIRSGA